MALQSLSRGWRQDLNTAKLGYFRTDDETVARLSRLVVPSDDEQDEQAQCVLFDPCCGEGLAAQQLGAAWQAKTFGVEYDGARFVSSASRLGSVLHADALNDVVLSRSWAGVMLFNPPYGDTEDPTKEGKRTRLEALFWQHHATRVVRGGVMIAILPAGLFARAPGVVRAMSHYFAGERAEVYKAAVDTYDQVVVVGYRRRDTDASPNKALSERLSGLAHGEFIPPDLPEAPEQPFQAPPGHTPDVFEAIVLTEEVIQMALEQESPDALEAVEKDLEASHAQSVRHPSLMPLRQGHIPLLLAAGGLDGIVTDEQGAYLVKGSVKRIAIENVEETEHESEDGRSSVTRSTSTRYQWQTRIMAWDLTPGHEFALLTIE